MVELYVINLLVCLNMVEVFNDVFLKKYGCLFLLEYYVFFLLDDYKVKDFIYYIKVFEIGLYVFCVILGVKVCFNVLKFFYFICFKVFI